MKFRLDETLNMVLLTLLQEMDHTLKLHQNLHFYGAGSQPGSPAAPLKWDTTLESLFFRGKTSVHRQCVLSLYADRNAYIFHDQIRVYGNIGENNRDVWLKGERVSMQLLSVDSVVLGPHCRSAGYRQNTQRGRTSPRQNQEGRHTG